MPLYVVQIPSLDADHAFMCLFDQRTEDMNSVSMKNAFVQTALLYTNLSGQRLIRIQTLHIHITTSANNEFRYADTAAVSGSAIAAAVFSDGDGGTRFPMRNILNQRDG